jgi:hypothetical protein
MANIIEKVKQIRQAIYGKDVRESIASSIEDMNTEVENNTSRQDAVEVDFTNIKDSEVVRVTNETARTIAEESRLADEVTRINDEITRVSNENLRESIINASKICETYDSNHTYYLYNKAVQQGSTYQCINPSIEGIKGIAPINDGINWLCIALKGQDGIGGDMFKSRYDTNDSGSVDNAEKLGGQAPNYYASNEELDNLGEIVSSQLADTTAYREYLCFTEIRGMRRLT